MGYRIVDVKVAIIVDDDDNRSNHQICIDIGIALESHERVADIDVIDPHGRRITT